MKVCCLLVREDKTFVVTCSSVLSNPCMPYFSLFERFFSFRVYWKCVVFVSCILEVCCFHFVYTGNVLFSFRVYWKCVVFVSCILEVCCFRFVYTGSVLFSFCVYWKCVIFTRIYVHCKVKISLGTTLNMYMDYTSCTFRKC